MNFSRVKGILLGLAATACWGSTYPASRFLFGSELEQVNPIFFSFLVTAVTSCAMLPFLSSSRGRAELKKYWKSDWFLFLVMAVMTLGEGLLVYAASKYTTAARVSLLANTSPIFTALIAFFVVKESLNRSKVFGMILGFAGIFLAASSQGMDVFTKGVNTLPGDMMALCSGACWATYTVVAGKMALRNYGSMFIGSIVYGLRILMLIVIVLLMPFPAMGNFSVTAWLGILYLGIFPGFIATCCWYQALKHLHPGELGSFGYFSATLAVTFSVIFLQERFSWLFILAIPCVLGGVALMLRRENTAGADFVCLQQEQRHQQHAGD